MRFMVLVLMLVVLGREVAAEPAVPTGTYTVDRIDDSTGHTCASGIANNCTLRSAIQLANASTGADVIYFHSSIPGVLVESPLPAFTDDNVHMQAFSNQDVWIEALDSADVTTLFTVSADNITIDGLKMFGTYPNNDMTSQLISVTSGSNNTIIRNNVIGNSTASGACGGYQGGRTGINVGGTASNVYIYDNAIRCLTGSGIYIGASTSGVRVGRDENGGDQSGTIKETWRGITIDAEAYIYNTVVEDSTVDGILVNATHVGIRNVTSRNNGLAGVHVINGSFVDVIDSTLSGNQIGVRLATSADTAIIQSNTINNNTQHGIFVAGSDDNNINNNDIHDNGWDGVFVDNVGSLPLDNIIRANDIMGNRNGIWIEDSVASAEIDETWIFNNSVYDNDNDGIYITRSEWVQIGCHPDNPTLDLGNAIYGNASNGIVVNDPATDNVGIYCNHIGVQADGTTVDGNGGYGIYLTNVTDAYSADATPPVTIGGSVADGIGNIIGGNSFGIYVYWSHKIDIFGNYIGVLSDGTNVGNSSNGIRIATNASDIDIGDDSADHANFVGYNDDDGIAIVNASHSIDVGANTVGVRPNNILASAANSGDGIFVQGTNDVDIGLGSTPCTLAATDPCLLIGYNDGDGIQLDSNDNFVGVKTFILNNSGTGLRITGQSNHTNIPFIWGNGSSAAIIDSADGTTNSVFVRDMQNNGGVPVDLNNDGFTPNDDGDGDVGPNHLRNFPVASSSPKASLLTGVTCAGCGVWIYDARFGDYVYLDGTSADGVTGQWSYDLTPHGLTTEEIALMTADQAGPDHSSEMGPVGGGTMLPTAVTLRGFDIAPNRYLLVLLTLPMLCMSIWAIRRRLVVQ